MSGYGCQGVYACLLSAALPTRKQRVIKALAVAGILDKMAISTASRSIIFSHIDQVNFKNLWGTNL